MKTEILERVKDQIKAHPEQFNMDDWECGSTACIIGWIHRNEKLEYARVGYTMSAAKALGVSFHRVSHLGYLGEWPEMFLLQYLDATTNEEKVKVACDRIDHFIATEE